MRTRVYIDGFNLLYGCVKGTPHKWLNVHAPVLIIGGALDVYTPPNETRAIYAAANQPKQLWIVPGASHDEVGDHPEYEPRLEAFLARALK